MTGLRDSSDKIVRQLRVVCETSQLWLLGGNYRPRNYRLVVAECVVKIQIREEPEVEPEVGLYKMQHRMEQRLLLLLPPKELELVQKKTLVTLQLLPLRTLELKLVVATGTTSTVPLQPSSSLELSLVIYNGLLIGWATLWKINKWQTCLFKNLCCTLVHPDALKLSQRSFIRRIDFAAHDDKPYMINSDGGSYTPFKHKRMFVEMQQSQGVSTSYIVARIVKDYDIHVRRNLARGCSAQERNSSHHDQDHTSPPPKKAGRYEFSRGNRYLSDDYSDDDEIQQHHEREQEEHQQQQQQQCAK